MAGQEINTPDEIWKAIPGFPGYEVSDQGRVRSFRKLLQYGKWKISDTPQRILMPVFCGKYLYFSMVRDKKRHQMTVHKAVLLAFKGPPPPGMEGCHNDGIRTNCFLENLRWDTKIQQSP